MFTFSTMGIVAVVSSDKKPSAVTRRDRRSAATLNPLAWSRGLKRLEAYTLGAIQLSVDDWKVQNGARTSHHRFSVATRADGASPSFCVKDPDGHEIELYVETSGRG